MAKTKKGGPVSKVKKDEIKSILRTLIVQSNLGKIDSFSYEDLAKKYKTTRQTISNYVKEIYADVPEEELEKVYIDLRIVFEKLEREVNAALIEAETVRDKCMVINTYFKLVQEKIDLMEKFGKKEKIADKVDLTADITQKSLNINVITTNPLGEE